jgi:predicted house-cleaning noncanonical NTP pyrophosphatase (MazG superfamily)
MKYNKLVRDKIPEIIRKKGGKAIVHKAQGEEYWKKLKEKVLEEFKEFLQNQSEEEYVDILEVIDEIGRYKKFDKKRVLKLKAKKFRERGGFRKRIILEEA